MLSNRPNHYLKSLVSMLFGESAAKTGGTCSMSARPKTSGRCFLSMIEGIVGYGTVEALFITLPT